MKYRLIKSEPYKYSRDQFVKDGETMRDGVRNFQARNNLRAMRKGDLCFWYHSNEGKEIVGIAKVSKEAYPDPTAIGEKGDRVVVNFVPYKKLSTLLSLGDIKDDENLQSMCLLKQQRLSVGEVTAKEYTYIMKKTKTSMT